MHTYEKVWMQEQGQSKTFGDPAGPTVFQPEPQPPVSGSPAVAAVSQLPNSHALAAVAHLFQTSGGQEVSCVLHHFDVARPADGH